MRLGAFSKTTLGVVAAFCIVMAALLFGAWAREDDIDWNPFVRSDHEMEGDWLAESTVLMVSAGRYECIGSRCGELGSRGTWQRDGDFYVKVTPNSQESKSLRLGLKGKQLLVAAGAGPGDPDQWSPRVKFTRARPWSS